MYLVCSTHCVVVEGLEAVAAVAVAEAAVAEPNPSKSPKKRGLSKLQQLGSPEWEITGANTCGVLRGFPRNNYKNL